MNQHHLIEKLPAITIVEKTEHSVGIVVNNTTEIQHFPETAVFTVFRGYAKLILDWNAISDYDRLLEVHVPNEK